MKNRILIAILILLSLLSIESSVFGSGIFPGVGGELAVAVSPLPTPTLKQTPTSGPRNPSPGAIGRTKVDPTPVKQAESGAVEPNQPAGKAADNPPAGKAADNQPTGKSSDNQPANIKRNDEKKEERKEENKVESDGVLWNLLGWAVIILPVIIVVGGITWGIYFLYQNKQRERAEIRMGFSDLKTRNSTLSQKLDTLNKITTDLSQQIAQQKSEIGRLKQNIADASTSVPPPPIEPYQREQPRFPVSVTDYLANVGQGTPVKYEYKDDILLSDPSNEGGLVIVRDEGRLYLVPSYGYFQTKGDYTNYFEKYYSCVRPMGGNVWILRPATVNQMGDGWQLSSQGELEIR